MLSGNRKQREESLYPRTHSRHLLTKDGGALLCSPLQSRTFSDQQPQSQCEHSALRRSISAHGVNSDRMDPWPKPEGWQTQQLPFVVLSSHCGSSVPGPSLPKRGHSDPRRPVSHPLLAIGGAVTTLSSLSSQCTKPHSWASFYYLRFGSQNIPVDQEQEEHGPADCCSTYYVPLCN